MFATQIAQKTVLESRDDELLSSERLLSNDAEDTKELIRYEEFCNNADIDLGTGSPEIFDHYTPHGIKHSKDNKTRKRTISDQCNATCLHHEHKTPLPLLIWADSKSVWEIMMHKADVAAQARNCHLFEGTTIAPRMRAILIEWLMEVCEVYHLRRSTYYLAVDYLDRYLSINSDVSKYQLQLLGISALYIAAKFEEIYPPKVAEFAYVCDGACTTSEILLCERLLVHALSWDLNPMTPTSWLNLYMQIYSHNKNLLKSNVIVEQQESEFFIYPRYSAFDFVKASHLMDLFSLDPCFLLFKYNVIAASAMYYLYGKGFALKVSGLEWKDIESCIEYMAVFYTVIRNANDPKLDSIPTHISGDRRDCATFNFLRHRIPNIIYGEHHALQTRAVSLDYLVKSCMLRLQRMGFRIKKKINSTNKPPNDNTQTNSPELEEAGDGVEDDESAVTFHIEKDDNSVDSTHNRFVPEVALSPVSNENEDIFPCKSELSFDEMIEGINEYTIKKVLISNNSSEPSDASDVPE